MALIEWMGPFFWPREPATVTAAVLAGLTLGLCLVRPAWLSRGIGAQPARVWVAMLALTAALLSEGYIHHYLRGAPRVIDATSYWLAARTFAAGAFTFEPPAPLASFGGRFLLQPTNTERLAVIFPPGYPLLLALGWLARAPMLVGPLLAAALVFATHALARAAAGREDVALLAAALSTFSAALRYHTADTMSHGWAALLGVAVLLGVLRATRWTLLGAGLAAGWLIATRPVSGAVFLGLGLLVLGRRPRRWAPLLLGTLPGLTLLLAHQYAATGEAWVGSQARYYALADGPPGCFSYGLGVAVGCRFEHGDYVETMLPQGFGWAELCRVTQQRLFTHLRDAGNLPLLAPLLLVGAGGARRRGQLGWLALGMVGIVAAYAPFYFDGSYPGAGARFYADALPLEHVLLAQGFITLRAAALAVPLLLAGFAFVVGVDHGALAERDHGRPFFESHHLSGAGIERGLVFVDTDHGFALGHDPRVEDPGRGLLVARRRGDHNDRLLWEGLGRPPSYRYDGPHLPGGPRVVPWSPPEASAWRYEAESYWPLETVSGGWVHPEFPACASGGRALRLRSTESQLVAGFSLLVPRSGSYRVRVGWASYGPCVSRLRLKLGEGSRERRLSTSNAACWTETLESIDLPAGPVPFTVEVAGDQLALDFLVLERAGLR